MLRILFFVAAFLAFHCYVAAAATPITGKEAEAIALAVKVFKSKQGTTYEGWPVYGDLRHYTVELKRHAGHFDVIFVPDQPHFKPNEAGPGGGTKYGWEVHYVLSLTPLKIIEEHYAR
ncbi:MAG TPA: hypothetical protein VGQ95_05315 [Chthoniobacterales bacterium]|nr:hypothetical protein [Chthoniobacterales bacterium]